MLHAEAEAFWTGAAGAPHRDRVLERLARIARELLDSTRVRPATAIELLDCLPGAVRRAAQADHWPLPDAPPPEP